MSVDRVTLRLTRVNSNTNSPTSALYKTNRDNLQKITHKQYILTRIPIYPTMRLDAALKAIIENKDFIKKISSQHGIPAEMIASIIVKEQVTVSAPDRALMIHTFIRGSEHTYGLGAVGSNTAYLAWKRQFELGNKEAASLYYEYTSSYRSMFNLSDERDRNTVISTLLIEDYGFSIRSIVYVVDYWYNVFKEAYPEYRKRYYELFGENNANKDLYLVQDVNKGYTSQIIGHVLSWYNQGRDYVYYDKQLAKTVNNDKGMEYATLTEEYFKDAKAILSK